MDGAEHQGPPAPQDVGQQLQGAVSAFLASEITSALGISDGPLGDFVTAAGTLVVNQVITNITTGANIFEGVSNIDFGEVGPQLVYTYVGSKLGAQVYDVETT